VRKSDLAITFLAIVCITSIEIFALSRGLNGQFLAMAYGLIGSHAGAPVVSWITRKYVSKGDSWK